MGREIDAYRTALLSGKMPPGPSHGAPTCSGSRPTSRVFLQRQGLDRLRIKVMPEPGYPPSANDQTREVGRCGQPAKLPDCPRPNTWGSHLACCARHRTRRLLKSHDEGLAATAPPIRSNMRIMLRIIELASMPLLSCIPLATKSLPALIGIHCMHASDTTNHLRTWLSEGSDLIREAKDATRFQAYSPSRLAV